MSTPPSNIPTFAQTNFANAKEYLTAELRSKISDFRAQLVTLAHETETREKNMRNTLEHAAPAQAASERQETQPHGDVAKAERMKALCVQYTLLLVLLEGTLREEDLEGKGIAEVTEYLVGKTAEYTELAEEFDKELREVKEIVEEEEEK
jgi:hypothetical protein